MIVADPEFADFVGAALLVPGGAKAVVTEVDWLTSVITTCVALVTVGAMNRPELEMLPVVLYQVTPVRFVPVMVAVSCKLPADCTSAVEGETCTAEFDAF